MDQVVLIAAAAVAVAVVLMALVSWRARSQDAARMAQLADTARHLAAAQERLSERLQMTQSGVNERLDSLAKRLGDALGEQTEKTGETLRRLHERLAVIDSAQKNITDLSQQMVGLQDILSNKQARGAFGEIQLRDLVTAILPHSAYEFQTTLSTRVRADCLVRLPNPPGPIVIDAKFPLESYAALRDATDEAARVHAARAFDADVRKHVRDIAERYIVAGETAESALMFLPSEAVYAELHANFRSVVEDSFRRRVWIVSPTTLMATLNTVRAVLKDVSMREQAGIIQKELREMLDDVGRLDKRVDASQKSLATAARHLDDVRTSTDKIAWRAERIEEVQLSGDTSADDLAPPPAAIEKIG